MNRSLLGTSRLGARAAPYRRQHVWLAVLALAVCGLVCSGGGIAAAQTLADTFNDETVADGGTCMADDPFVPLDPIGDPEESADEVNLNTGIFDNPFDSPEAIAEAFDAIEVVDQGRQGSSLIPEPGTLLTLALAALMLLLLRRKW